MEGQKGKWFLIQSQPNPFLSQCRDRRSEKESALAWGVSPVGEGVGGHARCWRTPSPSRTDGASHWFSSEDKRPEARRKAVGAGISAFVAGEYAVRGEKSVPNATKISV